MADIKMARHAEAEAAAEALGVTDLRCFDADDYPIRPTLELETRLVRLFRELQPTAVRDRKRAAMRTMAAQDHLWDYDTDVAKRRGGQAARNSGPNLGHQTTTMAEAGGVRRGLGATGRRDRGR